MTILVSDIFLNDNQDDKDGPDFYFLFLNGSQDSPNLSFASIDWDRDCPIPPK